MSTIQSNTEIIKVINTYFSYLEKKGFQITEVLPYNPPMFWCVVLEGKCRIQINCDGYDGIEIYLAEKGTNVFERKKWYTLGELIWILSGQEVAEKYYKESAYDCAGKVVSSFLSTYLDKVVELIASSQFKKQSWLKIKQIRLTLKIKLLKQIIALFRRND